MVEILSILVIITVLFLAVWYPLIKGRKRSMIKSIVLMMVILIGIAGSTYRISKSRTFQFFGQLTYQGTTDEKVVALTFDDGPYPGTTDAVLKTLEALEVKGTFFLNGESIDANPMETKAIIDAGHELGNHSYSHPRMVFMSYSEIQEEMEATDTAMRNLGYEPTGYVRSPYCKKLLTFPWYLRQTDQINAIWTLEPETYYESAEDMLVYTIENIEPGGIILLHVLPASRVSTRELLEPLIRELKEEGYSFVTISEMLE